MTEPAPLVSVVIPARDEAEAIGECLDAVLGQDHPLDRLEVIVVDGASADETVLRARQRLDVSGLARWEVVANPAVSTPSSLNRGLEWAEGDIVCRVDARCVIPPHFVRTCAAHLERNSGIAVVGGAQVARARPGGGAVERAVARALRNRVGTGLARYRRGGRSGPADTVYLGAFRAAQLRAVGGWDERFATNQDFELNRRMRTAGEVWFLADLPVVYRPRTSLADLARQYRRFGRWKAAGWTEGGVGIRPRQLVLLMIPPVAIATGLAALRRAPIAAVLVAAGVAVGVDGAADGEDGPAVRALSLVAVLVAGVFWWSGIAEQLLRRLGGQRLLSGPAPVSERRG